MTLCHSPLLADFYQLTMAYGYWQLGVAETEATFHLLFRKNPFQGNYALSCGLASVVDYIENWRFEEDDLAYLATLKRSNTNQSLFPNAFLDYLKQLRFTGDLDAIPEGTIVVANEPIIRVQGPIIQCQLLESALLNILNFQTLIATKASRVCRVAGEDCVIEFGLRRAQGPDGALSASRAAYIGGCVASSNTLAGKYYRIPVRGTHAHSWVTAFPTEQTAFSAYADVFPENCVLLVDTYHTLSGVQHAIEIGQQLRQMGHTLKAIRLDSGDLAELSIKARKCLDQAGFTETKILASNSLDEYVIADLKQQGATIDLWGVGTNLVTAYDHPALDGVYKLSALKDASGWIYKLKLSEQEIKVPNPGRHQVRRFFCNEQYILDVIYDLDLGISDTPESILLDDTQSRKKLDDVDAFVDLLEPIFHRGKLVKPQQLIHEIRKEALFAVKDFDRQHGQHSYPIALESNLFQMKQRLLKQYRKVAG